MIPFDDEEEGIAIANDSDFGLYDYVFSKDGARALRVAKRLQAGHVGINTAQRNHDAPFGGFKMSGIGRDGGRLRPPRLHRASGHHLEFVKESQTRDCCIRVDQPCCLALYATRSTFGTPVYARCRRVYRHHGTPASGRMSCNEIFPRCHTQPKRGLPRAAHTDRTTMPSLRSPVRTGSQNAHTARNAARFAARNAARPPVPSPSRRRRPANRSGQPAAMKFGRRRTPWRRAPRPCAARGSR